MTLRTPAQLPCWLGTWHEPSPEQTLWAIAAGSRTVQALPRLHPWRLGDTKGTSRTLLWLGAPSGLEGVVTLTQTRVDPTVRLGDVSLALGSQPSRWMGGLVRLPGTWLPALAVLPRSSRDFDDPGTRWSTESIDFAHRHTVHADDTRYAADLLAPHVMAIILDSVPDGAAITAAGDCLHVWLRDSEQTQTTPGLAVRLLSAAGELKTAIPGFVYVDHPDRSHLTEGAMAATTRSAQDYRAARRLGRSVDPTLQRIYDKAQAQWEAGQVSSNG